MDYHALYDPSLMAVLSIIVIGFTPSSSLLRVALLPVLSAMTWHCIQTCTRDISRGPWAGTVAGYAFALLMHYVDIAVLSRWAFELQGPERNLLTGAVRVPSTKPAGRSDGDDPLRSELIARLKFGLSVFCSMRFINTPHQPKTLPRLSEELLQSRARFLVHTAVRILFCYLFLDLIGSMSDSDVPARFYTLDKVSLLTRLHEVTLEEMVMRFGAAFASGASSICIQGGLYHIMAFLTVATGLQSPEDWPPYSGPISRAYSVRNFWSVFWHQINTHRLCVVSHYLLFDVLRMKRASRMTRYARPFLIFFVSAVTHIPIDLVFGTPISRSGALPFFCIQPLGILIEDLAYPIRQLIRPSSGGLLENFLYRFLGFMWTAVWMAWTAPAYVYPMLAQDGPRDDGIVPVSIIGYVKHIMEEKPPTP